MAEVEAIQNKISPSVSLHRWNLTTADPIGEAITFPSAPDRSVHVYGNFGTGGSVTIQGSNDPDVPANRDYATLHDLAGGDLTFTATGLEVIAENPAYIRPNLTAGTGVDLYVAIVSKGR